MYRKLTIVVTIAILIVTFYLTNWYLKENFSNNGEAYMKGAGQLLEENFWNAVFFLTARHLSVSTTLSFLLFTVTDDKEKRQVYNALLWAAFLIIALTLAYILYQTYNILNGSYDRKERVVEIALTWCMSVLGFFLGYWLTKLNSTRLKKLQHIS